MTGFAKGLVISVVVVVLIIAAGVAAGVYWLSAHSGEYLEKGKQTMLEGEHFGKQTDNQGCVVETLVRYKQIRSPGFSNALSTELFLQGCLHGSRPTTGFCDNIPRQTEFIKSAKWQMQQCSDHDLHDSYCPQIFGQLQTFCESQRERK